MELVVLQHCSSEAIVRVAEKKQKEEEARKKAEDEEIFLQDRDNRLALEGDDGSGTFLWNGKGFNSEAELNAYKIDFEKLEAERRARNN